MQLAGRLFLVSFALASLLPARGFAYDQVPVAERSDIDWIASFRELFTTARTPGRSMPPDKCATRLVREYDLSRSHLSPAATVAIDAWLDGDAVASATLETSHFRFEYALEGVDAVPLADVAPADGVPDFVANVAGWAETSWTTLVEGAGFAPPFLRAGRVDVTFREMSAFGYSRLVEGVPALVLHRNYVDFPGNDDPDGPIAGAAKVTIAHELKHALQYASSRWTEGGWLEADAVWAEDFVFDETNDYVRYLGEGSPISDPAKWLPASYEDCLFPRLLSERHGSAVLVEFFARRALARSEPVLDSFDVALRARGSSLSSELAQLGLWTWFCGANASDRPAGFEEAAHYPSPPIAAFVDAKYEARLAALGTHHVLATAGGRAGTPRISFASDGAMPFAVWSVVLDREGRRSCRSVPLNGLSAVEIGREWEDLATVTLIVTHVDRAEPDTKWGVSIDADAAVGVDPWDRATGFLLHANRPNPFREETAIAFSLPEPTAVRIAIYDVAGKLVRVLEDGSVRASGTHAVVWDGRDSRGRRVAPGLYASRVEAYGRAATRKMLLVR